LYRFLVGLFPESGSRNVHGALLDYLERAESVYGADRVWSYTAVQQKRPALSYRRTRAVCLAIVITGFAWIGVGVVRPQEPAWIPLGILSALFGGIFFLATFSTIDVSAGGIKNWRSSSLVITPGGFAMVQGDVQGIVKWDELLDVRLGNPPKAFRLSHSAAPRGISVRVAGAAIVIADIYDRPLAIIHQRIVANWRPSG
jgi:hypothetical protein